MRSAGPVRGRQRGQEGPGWRCGLRRQGAGAGRRSTVNPVDPPHAAARRREWAHSLPGALEQRGASFCTHTSCNLRMCMCMHAPHRPAAHAPPGLPPWAFSYPLPTRLHTACYCNWGQQAHYPPVCRSRRPPGGHLHLRVLLPWRSPAAPAAASSPGAGAFPHMRIRNDVVDGSSVNSPTARQPTRAWLAAQAAEARYNGAPARSRGACGARGMGCGGELDASRRILTILRAAAAAGSAAGCGAWAEVGRTAWGCRPCELGWIRRRPAGTVRLGKGHGGRPGGR